MRMLSTERHILKNYLSAWYLDLTISKVARAKQNNFKKS